MVENVVIVNGVPVKIEGEKNLLQLIRKSGIELPTFCYYPELSIYGACRMCVVENEWGVMEAACSTPPKAGMKIYTNTPKLRKHRKMILELLLSSHCRDCTICDKNGKCKLQEFALKFGINSVRFNNSKPNPLIDNSSFSIVRDSSKCILCGACVRTCNEIQNVGAIDFVKRGSKMKIACSFDKPISSSNCVNCGQCASICPTGAITIKNDYSELWNLLADSNNLNVVQIAPAVRVAISKEFGYNGNDAMGKIVSALKILGFNYVFDTSTSADLTAIEEAKEFIQRLDNNKNIPLFTSCCPAWVKYVENEYPEFIDNVSTCRSPMQMFASIIKEKFKNDERKLISVAVMPCTAKKSEAKRNEFMDENGNFYVDYVITTQELIKMIKESGLSFNDLEPSKIDTPFETITGAGVIFGVTGGVAEAVIRHVIPDKSNATLEMIKTVGVRGLEGIKEFEATVDGKKLKICVVSGLGNANNVLKRIKAGEHFDLVEVMACPGGCINGAGQPIGDLFERQIRSQNLYKEDIKEILKSPEQNPLINEMYKLINGKEHELLHVQYKK